MRADVAIWCSIKAGCLVVCSRLVSWIVLVCVAQVAQSVSHGRSWMLATVTVPHQGSIPERVRLTRAGVVVVAPILAPELVPIPRCAKPNKCLTQLGHGFTGLLGTQTELGKDTCHVAHSHGHHNNTCQSRTASSRSHNQQQSLLHELNLPQFPHWY